MINGLDPVLAAGLDAACIRTLTKPMSHSGRKLMNKHLAQLMHRYATKMGMTQVKAMDVFTALFDPTVYESAAQRYECDGYPGQGAHSKWPGTTLLKGMSVKDQFEYCTALKHFDDDRWHADHSLKRRPHVGSVTNERTAKVYTWITTYFLVTDFTDAELNKICEMGSDSFDLDTIKKYASQISDPQKRSASYLYAIARDASLKESVSRTRLAEEEARQKDSFIKAISYISTPRSLFEVTDEDHAAIERTAEYMRILQESKDND